MSRSTPPPSGPLHPESSPGAPELRPDQLVPCASGCGRKPVEMGHIVVEDEPGKPALFFGFCKRCRRKHGPKALAEMALKRFRASLAQRRMARLAVWS